MKWISNRMKWISVKDRLPEEGDTVLVFNTSGGEDCLVTIAIKWPNEEWFLTEIETTSEEVTHWMPLPEPPKQ